MLQLFNGHPSTVPTFKADSACTSHDTCLGDVCSILEWRLAQCGAAHGHNGWHSDGAYPAGAPPFMFRQRAGRPAGWVRVLWTPLQAATRVRADSRHMHPAPLNSPLMTLPCLGPTCPASRAGAPAGRVRAPWTLSSCTSAHENRHTTSWPASLRLTARDLGAAHVLEKLVRHIYQL